jgi:uncharacterized protein YbaP (TraB family)
MIYRKALGLCLMTSLALIFALHAPAKALTPPDSAESSGWSVPEVVVRAPAPRLWKLTKGNATVYVLGSVEPLPKGLSWNSAQVGRILSGADRLLTPPVGTVGTFGAIGALTASHLPGGRTLDQSLPPDLASRLRAVLVRLNRNPDSLQTYKLGWAALDLERAVRSSGQFTDDEPVETLTRLAREKKVTIRDMGRYDVTPVLKQLENLPDEEGVAALRLAVGSAEHELDNGADIGRAWADGNLRNLRRAQGPDASMAALIKVTPLGQYWAVRAEADALKSIDGALEQPGVSVTTMGINQFAKAGGLIDKLRAQGVQVTEPAE